MNKEIHETWQRYRSYVSQSKFLFLTDETNFKSRLPNWLKVSNLNCLAYFENLCEGRLWLGLHNFRPTGNYLELIIIMLLR